MKDAELREAELSYVCLGFPVLRLILVLKSLYKGGMPALPKVFFLEV